MDIPTLLLNLKEDVSCSVCTQLYKDPKQLPCLHIFCLECLNDMAKTQLNTSVCHGKIKFPLRHIEFAVPKNRTMETLPSCFYVKNLLDILAIKECSTLKELRHRSCILKKLAKLFKIVISNPFQSSPSSAILVPFCFRITPLVFFFLSKLLFLGFPTL